MTIRLFTFVTAVAIGSAGIAQTPHLQPSAPRTIVTVDASAPPVVRAGLLQSTLIELLAEEKVATVFGGDTVSWVFDAGHVASRYISIKPKAMTAAQRAALYGANNPDAPKATSQMSERQAEAKQAELAREKQHQDALNSDTVAVDFARPTVEATSTQPHASAVSSSTAGDDHLGKSDTVTVTDAEEIGNRKPESKDAAINKYDFDTYDGKLYRMFEGSVFEGVVINHVDGGLPGPILLMLTTDYYSHDHQQLLLPQGTRLVGSVQAVNTSQARKMVVSFHRAICPDGFSVDLDKFAGLDPLGTAGLATKVDNRYLQTFAVAAAIGGLGGLAQVGNNNILDPSAQIRNGISSQSSQEAEQILNHFLNRLPIITLKEGSRARVYIGRDLLIPSYAEHRVEPAM